MKINRLILRNFSAVKNALKANEVEIDFSTANNKVCLLIGPNGSGKTTILSQLHPFADVGNLDVRNGNNLILSGKDGYKEIEIIKGEDTYLIKHFYTPQKDKNHSVKSYIFKNDNDLNVNGNVTSFKEIVKEELQIEPDYLKLIRLGSNVTSLIDLSSTERKNFMSKIMDDIGIYLEYYKNINQKLRQVDELISHTIDKIKRLQITNEDVEKQNIENCKILLNKIENEFIEVSSEISKLNDFINSFGDITEFHSNGTKITNKYNKMVSILEKNKSIQTTDVKEYETKIHSLELEISNLEQEYDLNNILIQNCVSHLDNLHSQYRSADVQLTKDTNTDREIQLMEENLKNMRLKLREFEGHLIDFTPKFSKSDFDRFYSFVINTQKILNRTYEFGKKPIEKVIELLENDKNVMNYINKHLINIDDSKNDRTSLFMTALMTRFLFNGEVTIQCKEECQAKTLFNQIQNLLINSDVDDKTDDSSLYHDMEFVYNNLKTILPQFNEYQEIIDNLPEDIKSDFLISNMYKKIKKMTVIYDEKKMNEFNSLITEYDEYIKLSLQYEEQSEVLNNFSSLSNLESSKRQIKMIQDSIEEEEEKLTEYKNRNIEIQELIKELKTELEMNVDTKETIEEFDFVKSEYNTYISDRTKIFESMNEIKELKRKRDEIEFDKNKLQSDLQNYISNLAQYQSLQKDNKKFSKIFDDLTTMKSALSSKSGIPLRIISNYLNNTNEITNEFLDIVYDGRIYIDNFNITATEFSIPFFNNNVRLEDVKYASQGELSFLSIALSFALSSQVLSRYNIMLLDEIDGPLDISNREKFIKILEAQIDKIDSEQNFLITHNAMFSSYPVDIIDLSFENRSGDYELSHYVNIKRS